MVEERAHIYCPGCGANLLDQDISILKSQLTLELRVIGDISHRCSECEVEIGAYLAETINSYSRLVEEIAPDSRNRLPVVTRFIQAVQEALLDLESSDVGRLSRKEALELRFGLTNGGRGFSWNEIARVSKLSAPRGQQLVSKALLGLRFPSRFLKVYNQLPKFGLEISSLRSELARTDRELREAQQEAETWRALAYVTSPELEKKLSNSVEVLLPHLPSRRVYNSLIRSGLRTLGQVLAKGPDKLLDRSSFGLKALKELVVAFREVGVEPKVFWGEDFEKKYHLDKG